MTAKAEYIPNGYVCNKCGSRMDAIITPPLSTLGKIKLVCNNCNKHMTKNWQDEFDKQNFTDAWAEDESNRIKQFISDIIDKKREETIREFEGELPKEMIFNEETDSEESKTWIAGFNNCRNQILNKLKK